MFAVDELLSLSEQVRDDDFTRARTYLDQLMSNAGLANPATRVWENEVSPAREVTLQNRLDFWRRMKGRNDWSPQKVNDALQRAHVDFRIRPELIPTYPLRGFLLGPQFSLDFLAFFQGLRQLGTPGDLLCHTFQSCQSGPVGEQPHLIWSAYAHFYFVLFGHASSSHVPSWLPLTAFYTVMTPSQGIYSCTFNDAIVLGFTFVIEQGEQAIKPDANKSRNFCDTFEREKRPVDTRAMLVRCPEMDSIALQTSCFWIVRLKSLLQATWDHIRRVSSFGGGANFVRMVDADVEMHGDKSVLHSIVAHPMDFEQEFSVEIASVLTWCERCKRRVQVKHIPAGVGSKTQCVVCGQWK